ncbi:MAG: hypothetical protein ACR2MG_02525 [Pyrinomonadaceae bacterium]
MNLGLIIGVVRQAGRPLSNAVVGLAWVRGGGQTLPLYDANADSPTDRLRSQSRRGVTTTAMPPPLGSHVPLAVNTDNHGVFALSFQWSGTDLGIAMDNPQCQLYVTDWTNPIHARNYSGFTERMVRLVSLSQTMSGLIANPTQVFDQLGVGADILASGMPRGMLGRIRLGAPSPDMYALGAAFRINI